MLRNFLQSFALALQNIRTNLFHTFLSVLGIVIGVAALVATFSLIDGLEQFARQQISNQTSLNAISVSTETEKMVNNLSVRKDTFQVLDYARYSRFRASTPLVARGMLTNQYTREIKVAGVDTAIGAIVRCAAERPWGDTMIAHGQNFADTHFPERTPVAIINTVLAKLITGNEDGSAAIGKTLTALGYEVRIIGIAKGNREEMPPTLVMPISLLSSADLYKSPPDMVVEAAKTEDVPQLKTQIEAWTKQEFGAGASDFSIQSRDYWIDQTSKGFLIFRIIMGLIIGISVVVGGIGVMNVLLISVNERTAEIGLRKAVGAKKGDIHRLFLAESITVSAFGSMIGLVLGAGFAMAVIPIIRFFAEVPFNAVLTWNTFMVICVIAILIGILFGTYPAIKAARLDPVEALRRE
jgi:putative ABC transport system permease protein